MGFNLVTYCPINNEGRINFSACTPTGSGFNAPLGIAINPIGTFAYIANNLSGSISSCAISVNGTLSACIDNITPPLPYAVAINPANSFAYVATSTDVFYCSINTNGSLNSCNSTGSNTYNFPTAITINSAGTFAYITNLVGNTVSKCPIKSDGSFGTCVNNGNGLDGPDGIAILNI